MPSAEHEALVAALKSAPIVGAPTLAAQRANYDATLSANPIPDDVRIQSVLIDGNVADLVTIHGKNPKAHILYLHGGGYVIGSNVGYREFGGRLARAASTRVCLLNYRLAPESPYPAAVDDAVSAYSWLLAQGTPATKIIIAGDSAGGGLTLATLMALRDAGKPMPAGAVLLSPWADLTGGCSAGLAGKVDDPLVGAEAIGGMASMYAGTDTRRPGVSPLFGNYHGLPPLSILVGTRELLLEDSRQVRRAAEAAGVKVEYFEGEGLVHVWPVLSPTAPESIAALARITSFAAGLGAGD